MTICKYCDKDREEDDFAWRSKKLGTRNKKCKICQREYAKEHYDNNKKYYSEKSIVSNKKRREENRIYIDECKSVGCSKCDENEICCMDFHHINPEEKKFRIASGTSHTMDDLKLEINKCILVCVNCHRKIHAGIMGV